MDGSLRSFSRNHEAVCKAETYIQIVIALSKIYGCWNLDFLSLRSNWAHKFCWQTSKKWRDVAMKAWSTIFIPVHSDFWHHLLKTLKTKRFDQTPICSFYAWVRESNNRKRYCFWEADLNLHWVVYKNNLLTNDWNTNGTNLFNICFATETNNTNCHSVNNGKNINGQPGHQFQVSFLKKTKKQLIFKIQ